MGIGFATPNVRSAISVVVCYNAYNSYMLWVRDEANPVNSAQYEVARRKRKTFEAHGESPRVDAE